MNAGLPSQYVLLFHIVIPLWILAGLADWALHRRSNIATTSGPLESVFHLLLLAEVGIPLMVILLCDVVAASLLLLLGGCLLHSITVMVDTTYAGHRRYISPAEQCVHAYLEVLPYTALLLLASAHWPIITAMFSSATTDAGQEYWGLRWRDPPLSPAYLAAIFSAAVIFSALPYTEELLRGMRAKAQLKRTGSASP